MAELGGLVEQRRGLRLVLRPAASGKARHREREDRLSGRRGRPRARTRRAPWPRPSRRHSRWNRGRRAASWRPGRPVRSPGASLPGTPRGSGRAGRRRRRRRLADPARLAAAARSFGLQLRWRWSAPRAFLRRDERLLHQRVFRRERGRRRCRRRGAQGAAPARRSTSSGRAASAAAFGFSFGFLSGLAGMLAGGRAAGGEICIGPCARRSSAPARTPTAAPRISMPRNVIARAPRP